MDSSYPSDNRELYRFIRYAVQAQAPLAFKAVPAALSIARPSGQVGLGVVVEPIRGSGWVEGRGQPVVMLYVRDDMGGVQMSSKVAQELFTLDHPGAGAGQRAIAGGGCAEARHHTQYRKSAPALDLRQDRHQASGRAGQSAAQQHCFPRARRYRRGRGACCVGHHPAGTTFFPRALNALRSPYGPGRGSAMEL